MEDSERKFAKDWGRRIWLLDRVWAVMGYRVEVQERYLRWVLGVERTVPGHMVTGKLHSELLARRAGMRKLSEGKDGYPSRKWWMELRRRAKEGGVLKG